MRIATPPLSPSVYIDRRLMQEIYIEAGLAIEFVELPLARSIHAAELGLVDGELGRTPTVIKKNSSLRPLGTPLTMRIVSVRQRSEPTIDDIDALGGLVIGHLNGMRSVVASLQPGARTKTAVGNEQLLELLDRGRLDVALMIERDASVLVSHHPKLAIGPPLLTFPVFHYLQVRHRALLPLLFEAQHKLIANGRLDEVETGGLHYVTELYREHQRHDNRRTEEIVSGCIQVACTSRD